MTDWLDSSNNIGVWTQDGNGTDTWDISRLFYFLLQENGDYLLQEDGLSKHLLEMSINTQYDNSSNASTLYLEGSAPSTTWN